MLIAGETVNQRKAFLWSLIHLNQDLIKLFQDRGVANDPDFRESIKILREENKSTYNEIKDLLRWAKKEGIGPDEGYVYPSVKARWEAMTDKEKEAEMERIAEIEMKILAIKERNGWE